MQKNHLQKSAEKIGISLNEHQIDTINAYIESVLTWNNRMNLTAITDPQEILQKHILDALTIIHAVSPTANMKMIDVGTGAGFPGMVLAIAFPQIQITLTDALQKRVHFLKQVIKKLDLQNVTALHARAETIGQLEAHREKYNVVVARSVATLSTLAEYCLPLVRVGGMWIAYKKSDSEAEIVDSTNAITTLGGSDVEKMDIMIPNTHIARSLIVSTKKTPTPSIYPRRPGIPKKSPL